MKRIDQPITLIVNYKADPEMKSPTDPVSELKAANIPVNVAARSLQPDVILSKGADADIEMPDVEQYLIETEVNDLEVHPWDLAHAAYNASGNIKYVEPDNWQEFTTDNKLPDLYNDVNAKSFGTNAKGDDVDPDWPPVNNQIWHLDDDHSQLGRARAIAAAVPDFKVRIGHLDTGYTDHFAIPDEIKNNPLQRNLIEGENANKALDPGSTGILRQPYHGTGTGGILAGGKVTLQTVNGVFDDYLGAAYFADVVTCRISKSVVLFKASAFAQALNYLTSLKDSETPVHVVSMSMGGAPSKAWADAVNAAYMAGITVVTAAGNNFSGLPVRHLVYPARFKRVIAACGVTYDNAPYYTKLVNEMQGNYGPSSKMGYALAAFTPNMPWASKETGTIQFNGAGTSSATPQIAAAAAIYYQVNHKELEKLKPWQRVEAIRNALFTKAKKEIKKGFHDPAQYFGNGIIQALDALDVKVASDLEITDEDSCPWFPILDTLFKSVPDGISDDRDEMLNTEIWQLIYTYPELSAIINDAEVDIDLISADKWDALANAIMTHPAASNTLKAFIKNKYDQPSAQ